MRFSQKEMSALISAAAEYHRKRETGEAQPHEAMAHAIRRYQFLMLELPADVISAMEGYS